MPQKELLFSDLFEKTLDLICIVDEPGWFVHLNSAVVRTLGYEEEELFNFPVSAFIHPDDQERTKAQRTKLLNGVPLTNFQNRYIAKDGQVVWLEWTSVYIHERKVVFAIAKNITETKSAEHRVGERLQKYKELAAHFKLNVERDRHFFAAELHEDLAQLAAVIKMDLEWVRLSSFQLDDATKSRIEHGITAAQALIDKIRKLYYTISSSRLEIVGLDVALRSLCEEFSSVTGIQCRYKSKFDDRVITSETKLDIFRICQEALSNIMHHAQASKVSVHLLQRKKKIELSVRDNGRGFEHESKNSFGINDMQARAALINGELKIKSNRQNGTKVVVSVDAVTN